MEGRGGAAFESDRSGVARSGACEIDRASSTELRAGPIGVVGTHEGALAGTAVGVSCSCLSGSASNTQLGASPLTHEQGRMSDLSQARPSRDVAESTAISRPGGVASHPSGWLVTSPGKDRASGHVVLSAGLGNKGAARGAEAIGEPSGELAASVAGLDSRGAGGSSPAASIPNPVQDGLAERIVDGEISLPLQSPSTATCNVQGPAAFVQAEVAPSGAARIDDEGDVMAGEPCSRAPAQPSSPTGLPLTLPLVHR